ncbi:MAG: MarR family transcriptional regulator [Nitrosomonadales bacterium]|nr:MarR family transcriptional regulator [Nitrosomonadales bacterium]
MPQKSFIPVLRELARAYQEFESFSASHIRTLGLTPSQFDIVATLGNTTGMSFKELGEKTLITKGTLTGVVDRLEAKSLVRRVASPSDGRSQTVQLTRKGEALFARIFPAHLEHVAQAFTAFSQADLDATATTLQRLRETLFAAGNK